jgi:glycosyltransferase involved in cell wall biosynthesis
LQEIAKGLPVYFHFSASFVKLKKLYSRANIYWHATGFGQNPKKEPICFEHFGISTVEAMAAGAVPVVFDGGGQSEIITDDENGFLWDKVDQLVKKTQAIVNDSSQAKEISKAAINSSKKYSKKKFVEKLNEYLKQI